MLLPDNGIRIGGQRPAKMVNEARGGNRLGAVAPANRIAVGPVGPVGERRHQQHQKAAGAQGSAEGSKGRDVKAGARIKNSMPVLAPQQPADGFRGRFQKPRPVSRQRFAKATGLAQRPLFIATEHHQPTAPGTLKLMDQPFKPRHHIALPKVLHCDGLPLSKPRLNQL